MIGSNSTSSRPANALLNPSRCMSSCMSEKVVVGGIFLRAALVHMFLHMIIARTFRRTESRAAEYLNPFINLSNCFSRFLRRASTLNSATSPVTVDFCLDLVLRPWPMVPLPRNVSKAPDLSVSVMAASAEACDGLSCRRRTERVPSLMPAAMWVSSGYRWLISTLKRTPNRERAHRECETQNRCGIPHGMNDVVITDIVDLDHLVQTRSEQPRRLRVKRERCHGLLVVRQGTDTSTTCNEVPHSQDRARGRKHRRPGGIREHLFGWGAIWAGPRLLAHDYLAFSCARVE